MSIKNKQQISIHLKTFRNLSSYTLGRFYLRISVYTKIGLKKYFAIPINVIQKNISQTNNQAHTQENYYLTKSFALKSGSNADIDQICIFRFDVQISLQQGDYAEIQSTIFVQLIHCEYNSSRIVGQYKGITKGVISDAFIVDFYQHCPGQIIGSIHTCILNYQFIKSRKEQTKKTNKDQYINDLLKYLEDKSNRNYKKSLDNLMILDKQYKKITYQQQISKQNLNKQKNQKSQENTEEEFKTKRKRKAIFQNDIPAQKKINGIKKSNKLPYFQKILHKNSLKIYENWRQLNQKLLKKQGNQFINLKHKQYDQKLKNKIGESIIRFKGLKDIDMYSDSQQMERRNMMISQLRNLPKQLQTNEFKILNKSYFTKERPIFFQQTVAPLNQIQAQMPLDYMLIILVHGLGACRIDMQKLKIQLKRYYQEKVKIYVSTANQSRTEGDIDGMGLRLANQVQSQANKSKGSFKICMLGHSMGGLIIRSALPRLQKLKHKFYSLITFSSPHIGYAYSSSKLVDAGLWFINTMKKCVSIQQMTMTDKQKIEECFLYNLSQQPGLQWFKKVTFLASHQDLYVPFYSARIQKSKQIQTDFKKGFSRSVIYCQMIDNILNKINGRLTRLDVDFCIPQQNIDNLIGRAAHISFISNVQMLRTFCIAEQNSIF